MLYNNTTVTIPTILINGNQYYFMAYNYNNNYTFAKPIPNTKDDTIIGVFEKISTELTEKGHTLTFNVTDSQVTVFLKEYPKEKITRW